MRHTTLWRSKGWISISHCIEGAQTGGRERGEDEIDAESTILHYWEDEDDHDRAAQLFFEAQACTICDNIQDALSGVRDFV